MIKKLAFDDLLISKNKSSFLIHLSAVQTHNKSDEQILFNDILVIHYTTKLSVVAEERYLKKKNLKCTK